ncbi:MAG: AMP-binding protein [Myxococcales bacterium FL481]|nr:MAG: AMP-binding protein [Myxococcales bacterium FL481]
MRRRCCVHDLLLVRSDAERTRIAVIEGSHQTSYADLIERVHGLALWLRARGLRPGDRVAVHLRKSTDEIVAMLGASLAGGVFVNINHQWTPRQRDYVLADCDVRFLITSRKGGAALGREEPLPALECVLSTDGPPTEPGPANPQVATWSDVEWKGRQASPPDRIGADLAAILYTSGSTGRPKGVMLTHTNVLEGARSVADYLNNEPDDRLLSILPFSFDYGLNQLTTMMLLGGSIVLAPVSMASELVKLLREHACTGFAAVPPTWRNVVAYLSEQPCELPALRYITNSGGKIPPDTLAGLPRVFPGVEIVLMYGLTEAFRSTWLPPSRFDAKKGSMGRAIPNNQVFVINEAGICADNETGELVHRGPLVSAGYWGKPDATAEKIRPCPQLRDLIGDEPVVYSGDLVKRDADGDLWFVGRRDAMIKSSGFRIAPTEVEEIVTACSQVSEVVAFGVDDLDLGQAVHVAVTVHDASAFSSNELLEHCRQHMPTYMVPRRVHLHEGAFPRTSSGKLDVSGVARRYTPS